MTHLRSCLDRPALGQRPGHVLGHQRVGLWLGPGATGAYGFCGTIGTVAIVIVYLMSNIALMRYFWTHPERTVLTHVVVPTLGVAVLIYPLYSVANPLQPYPFNLVPIIVLAWVLAGLVLYLVYRARSPEKIAALGSFITADDLPAER